MHHWCIQELPELEAQPQKQPLIGNSHTAIIGDFHESKSPLWNLRYCRNTCCLLNLPRSSEEKPILHCSECSETFECQHDKERHWCIYSDLPELEVEPQKKFTSPIPNPEQVVALIGNSYTNRCSLMNLPQGVAIIGDSHESTSYLRNLSEDVAYITDICCHKNTCSLRNLPRKSDN